jgi:hypothetical protein
LVVAVAALLAADVAEAAASAALVDAVEALCPAAVELISVSPALSTVMFL